MKRNYESPTLEVVQLDARASFLTGSDEPYSNANVNVSYEEEYWQ
jgi:hypothetical protein